MASVLRQANGCKAIQFALGDKRPTIYLGAVPLKTAQVVKRQIEALVVAKAAGHSVELETANWLATIGPELHGKLARLGLCQPREKSEAVRLGAFLDQFITGRDDVTPGTRHVWRQVERRLNAHLGYDRDLADVTEADADEFKRSLIRDNLASTTVAKFVAFARMFFRQAVRRRLIQSNPFDGVQAKGVLPQEREAFVELADVERLLAVCDPTWQTIVALTRYAGLRCPSEVLSLKWSSVDFATGWMIVDSPKTAGIGKPTRRVPIFKELEPYLQDAFERAEPGAEFVIDRYRHLAQGAAGWNGANLRQQLSRLIERAGLRQWPRGFHSLRASKATELARDHHPHLAAEWLGHTVQIASRHYWRQTNDDFLKATGRTTGSTEKAMQNPMQQQAKPSENERKSRTPQFEQTPVFPVDSASFGLVYNCITEVHGNRTHLPDG